MNQELDAADQAIVAMISQQWQAREGVRVGDYVRYPDGSLRRVADRSFGFIVQTAKGGSFHVNSNGGGSFSGSLQYGFRKEFLADSGETKEGRFWFFSRLLAGAGRGRDCELPCRIYDLKPYRLSREDAEKHPYAIDTAEFWGKDCREYEERVEEIMNPPVMSNPDFY